MTHLVAPYHQNITQYKREAIDYKINSNVKELVIRYKSSPALLIEAAKQNANFAIDQLIASGYDINYKDINGDTALHHAARNLAYSSVWKLISLGADLAIENNKGKKAESLLRNNKIKSSQDNSEDNENPVLHCKKFFKIAEYTDYIISTTRVKFSKKDIDILEDIRFSTLLIRKLWNKIEKDGITIPNKTPDNPIFLEKIYANIDKFVSKIDADKNIANQLKACLLEEWKGRVEKHKEAIKLLQQNDIWSISELEDDQINNVVKKMQGHPELIEGLEKLKETPISLEDRKKIQKIGDAFATWSPNEHLQASNNCSNNIGETKIEKNNISQYQNVIEELFFKLAINNNANNSDIQLSLTKTFDDLSNHFHYSLVNQQTEDSIKNLSYILKLIKNTEFRSNDYLLKFLVVTNYNLMNVIEQYTTILNEELQDSIVLTGEAAEL